MIRIVFGYMDDSELKTNNHIEMRQAINVTKTVQYQLTDREFLYFAQSRTLSDSIDHGAFSY